MLKLQEVEVDEASERPQEPHRILSTEVSKAPEGKGSGQSALPVFLKLVGGNAVVMFVTAACCAGVGK